MTFITCDSGVIVAFSTTTNLGGSTLNGAINDSVTTITLTSSTGFASIGTVIIENEKIEYTGISVNDLTGCIRGASGTTAASHSDTTIVGEIFMSEVLSLFPYTQVQTHILSSNNGIIIVYFYANVGTDIVRTLTIPYSSTSGYQLFAAPAFTPYVKYEFYNTSGSTQTDFFYETKFQKSSISAQILGLDAFIAPNMTANLGRNILVGKEPESGVYNNIEISNTNELFTNTRASNKAKTSHYSPGLITAPTYAIFVDLSDIINWPHKQTGSISFDNLAISVDFAAANSSCSIDIGVITRIDGTDADISYIVNVPFAGANANTSLDFIQNYQPSAMSFETVGGALVNGITNYKGTAITAVNTGITLDSPFGSITPGLGDIIIFFNHSGDDFTPMNTCVYHSV